jgi:large subunit ribosomal protein L21
VYAIIEVGGKQYRVTAGESIEVERLPLKVGKTLEIERVLLLGGEKETNIGTPTVAGARVRALVAAHLKGDKVTVFKFRRSSNYQRKRGHRQHHTRLTIQSILPPGAKEVKEVKKEKPKAKPKVRPITKPKAKSKKATSLEELALSARTIKLLAGAGIENVEALKETLKKGEEALLGISGLGPKSLKEIKESLSKGKGG